MGCDTQGLLRGMVSKESILSVIRDKFDKNAKLDYCGESTYFDEHLEREFKSESCQIIFMYNDEQRLLNWYFDEGQYDIKNEEDVDRSYVYTQVSLGNWGSSVDIIENIVKEFSGYIDENDYDEEGFIPIIKSSEGTIKPVLHVTMQDIYEKFGCVVVIDK